MLHIIGCPDLNCTVSWGSHVTHLLLVLIKTDSTVIWSLFQLIFRINNMNTSYHISMTFDWNSIHHILRRWWIFSDMLISRLQILKMFLFHWWQCHIFKKHIVHEFMPFNRTIWICINFHEQLIQLFRSHIFSKDLSKCISELYCKNKYMITDT